MREGDGELVGGVGEEEGHVVVLDGLPDGGWGDARFEDGFAVRVGGCDETLDIWEAIWEGFSQWSCHFDLSLGGDWSLIISN